MCQRERLKFICSEEASDRGGAVRVRRNTESEDSGVDRSCKNRYAFSLEIDTGRLL